MEAASEAAVEAGGGLLVLAFCASSIGEERAGRRQPASFEQLEDPLQRIQTTH